MLVFCRYIAPSSLTWILLILTTTTELTLATFTSITDRCPRGFQLSYKDDQQPFCYRIKPPERFGDKFIDCPGNLYSFSHLRFIINDSVLESHRYWADYKSLYKGGPILDWPYKEYNYATFHKLYYYLEYSKEEWCVATGSSYENLYVFVCNESILLLRYCILKPYDEKLSKKGCEDLQAYVRFWSPWPTCLRTVAAGDAAMYNWTEADKFCKKTGGLILNMGWIYAQHSLFVHEELPMIPLDLDLQAECKCRECCYPETCTSCVRALEGSNLTLFDNSTKFSNLICERPVALKNITMIVSVDTQKEIVILSINDTVDEEHIYCYTDSEFNSSIIRPVRIHNSDVGSNSYTVKPLGDGYYWCINTDTENFYNVTESNRVLFIKDPETLLDEYAVKVYVQTLNTVNWDGTDWQRYLENSVAKQAQHYQVQYRFENTRLKERLRHTATLYVKIHPELGSISLKELLDMLWNALEEDSLMDYELPNLIMLSVVPVYFCRGFDLVPTLPLGASHLTTTDCLNYTCSGDFNDGVSWNTQIFTGCAKLKQVLEDLELLLKNETLQLTVDVIDKNLHQIDSLLQIEEEVEITGLLLDTLDRIGARIDLNGAAHGAVIRKNVALLIADSRSDAPIRGLRIAAGVNDVFTADDFEIISAEVDSSQLTTDESKAVVYLPESVVSSSRRISFVIFRNDRAFPNLGAYTVNSIVLSINVENMTKLEQGEVIDIHLKPLIDHPGRNQSRVCAYWRFNDNGTGYWSQEGCIFIRSYQRGTLDICRCNHLTHFAEVLVYRELFTRQEERVLEALTIVGCFLSIFGLFIVGLTAIVFESWRKEYVNKIWLQLCISIFLMMVCFLVVVFTKFDSYDMPCTVLGIALHYAVLASFCWMFVAAILNYRKLVTVFHTKLTHRILKTSVFSWGAPCVVITILLIVDLHSYAGNFEDKTPNGAFCYPSGLSKWLAVYAPILVILLANCTIYILILRSLFTSNSIQRQRDEKEAQRSVAVSCLLVFLFGLPWLFGLFADNIVAAYFFTLSAAYQGFILFVFFVLINKKTRALWWNKLKLKKKHKARISVSPTLQKRVNIGTACLRQRIPENTRTEIINDYVEEINAGDLRSDGQVDSEITRDVLNEDTENQRSFFSPTIEEVPTNLPRFRDEFCSSDGQVDSEISRDVLNEDTENQHSFLSPVIEEVQTNVLGSEVEFWSSDGRVASEMSRVVSNEDTEIQRSFLSPAIEEVQTNLPRSKVAFWVNEKGIHIAYQKMILNDESSV